MWGVRGWGLSHPRLPALWAGCRAPLPTGCGCEGVRAWGPVINPAARALASWLCALRGRQEGARGGRLLPACGASGVGRSPSPDCPPCGRAAGAHYPLAVGAGGCGRGDPSPTPQRALSPAGFARCGGGTRAPWGGVSCLSVGRPGSGALQSPTARPLGGLPGPTTVWLWVRGVRAWGRVTNPTARALASCLCELRGRYKGAQGGRLLPGCGASGVGRSPNPNCPPSGRACRGPLPTGCGCGGGAGVGNRHLPHSARSCVLRGRYEGARGWCLLPGCGASGVRRSPIPDCPPSGWAAGAHYPLAVGAGWCGCGDPSPTPQRALSRAGFARCRGGTRVPLGGGLLPGCGASGVGRSPIPDCPPSGWAAGARFPLAVAAVCGRGGPAVLGTLSCAAACRVLCAPPGFVAPGRRCGFAPVFLPWLWLAACLSGVPRGPALVRRSSSGLVALGALVGFPVAVVPSPTPGAVAPGFTGWLRGACGGRPRTGLIVLAAGPCRGKGAGHAPRRTRSGPRDGVVPGGSLRLRSWAACAAVVWCVWTPSLTRPVSCTVRLATGDSASAPVLFGVDADTALFGLEDATHGSPACVRVRALLGRVGRAGLLGVFWFASPFSWPLLVRSLLVRPPPGWGCPVCGCCWVFFLFLFPFPPLVAPPLCPAFHVFQPRVPWAFASCPPPFFFFSLPPLCAPCCLLLCVSSGLGCPGPWRLVAPPPFFLPVVCFLPLRVCCACCGVWCCGFPCPARSLCCARCLCCFWWLVLLVPGVTAFCWGSAGGSGCPAVSFGGVCRLWYSCLVWPSLGVFPVVSCLPVLCPMALCCRVVLCCGALSSLFFLSLLVALVSCCSPLVLRSWPVLGRFCFRALPDDICVD